MAVAASTAEKEAEFWGFNKEEVVNKLISDMYGSITDVVDGLQGEITRLAGRRADVNKIQEACDQIEEQIRDKARSRLTRLEKYCLNHIFVVPDEVLSNPEFYRPKKPPAAEPVETEDPLEAPIVEYVEPVDDAEFQELDAELTQLKKDLAKEIQRQRCLRADERILAQTRVEIEKANDYIETMDLGHFGRLDGGVEAGEEMKKLGNDLKRLEAKFGCQQAAGASPPKKQRTMQIVG